MGGGVVALSQRAGPRAARSNAFVVYAEGGKKGPKVLIAGGGIGGLAAALACKNRGLDVEVFERVTKYKPFGGPIQLQCNALGALESVDKGLAEDVISRGTVTGDRLNGLLDGVSGEWFMRFDTRKPCFKNGLPLTLVIPRFELLSLLRERVGDCVRPGTEVVRYEQDADGVTAFLGDGSSVRGDVLIGADGIHSKVRRQLRNSEEKTIYSGYTVYTAVCDFPAKLTDTSKVGYQVFLGEDQYFVSSDVGEGKQQYYAFLKVPEGGQDEYAQLTRWGDYREMLLDRFGSWNPAMKERLECTVPEDIERRDVSDIAPNPHWVSGRVALLGDACHAVQPNLGQGGGQAIESSYALAEELSKLGGTGKNEVNFALTKYAARRFLRTGAIHGLSRMAALMNTVYRPYLGSDPYDFYPEAIIKFWNAVEKLKIPHPGRVIGQIGMILTMDTILEYVGGGNFVYFLEGPEWLGGAVRSKERAPYCQVPGISAPKRPLTDADFKMDGIPGLAK